MKLLIVTPAHLGNRSGNSVTAVRWASIFSRLGHLVTITNEYKDESVDVMVALNAYRSSNSIQKFRGTNPNKPIIVALTGTDLYKFMVSHKKETLCSIETADRLVVLSDLAKNVLPPLQHKKVQLIYESAKLLSQQRKPSKRNFDICLIGHLRSEKDPFLAAIATRNLPASSKIRIRHFGKAHSEEWAIKAKTEMSRNFRYTWYGEVPRWKIRRALTKCNLLVITSKIEGGPNALSEAIVANVPVLASNIDGCVGVLGNDYPGYFPVGDANALQRLITRAETDVGFLRGLEKYVRKIAPRFSYTEEEARWASLLNGLSEQDIKTT